jgi:hypothetical protein
MLSGDIEPELIASVIYLVVRSALRPVDEYLAGYFTADRFQRRFVFIGRFIDMDGKGGVGGDAGDAGDAARLACRLSDLTEPLSNLLKVLIVVLVGAFEALH